MNEQELIAFAEKYTAAWCSQNAASVAAFFAEDGSLKINDANPAIGRTAITAAAQGFMTAFPDLVVKMDSVNFREQQAVYHWTLTGNHTSGHFVQISGYEEWSFSPDGLIAESLGHFDEVDYQRQLNNGGDDQS
ncbi:MAG: ester cyclase [Acidobacteria bacterium]|nr:ester cyclase [Acidobacteriota bacterium]